ncbi:MAG TPA: AMP-binding protein, partial [Polyangiaceae bacterium]|nr:AMP-binding protein [Polyangiaceae bacterium]
MDRIEEHGARTALIESSREYSYAELAARAQSTSQTLHDNGIGPQDAVVLQGRFGITSIACLLALHARGNIVAPVTEPTALARASLEENCRPSHWIDAREGLAIERLARSADPERPLLARLRQQGSAGLILLSSGTTSQPKVILHDLSRIVDSKLASGRKGGRLSIVLFLLFDHIGGINTLLGSLIAGNTAVAIRDH